MKARYPADRRLGVGVGTAGWWWLIPLAYGLFFLLSCASFVYTTRRGKFVVWAGLLSELHLTGRERVVDLGCGRGAVLIMLARLVPRGRAVGVDLWRSLDQSGNDPAGIRRPVGRRGSDRGDGTRPGLAFLVRRAVGTHQRGHRDPVTEATSSHTLAARIPGDGIVDLNDGLYEAAGSPPSHQSSTRSARRVFQRLGYPTPPSRAKWTRPGWMRSSNQRPSGCRFERTTSTASAVRESGSAPERRK